MKMKLLKGGAADGESQWSTTMQNVTQADLDRMNEKTLADRAAAGRVLEQVWELLGSSLALPTHGLLSLSDSARILGTSAAELRRRIVSGELPGVRLGGSGSHWRLRRVEVLRLLVRGWETPFRPLRMGDKVISGAELSRVVKHGTSPVRLQKRSTAKRGSDHGRADGATSARMATDAELLRVLQNPGLTCHAPGFNPLAAVGDVDSGSVEYGRILSRYEAAFRKAWRSVAHGRAVRAP